MSTHDAEADKMDRMYEWLGTVCDEFGIDQELLPAVVPQLLDLTRDVAHGPSRPAAPMTAFLLGIAAARQTMAGAGDTSGKGDDADEADGAATADLARHVLAGSTRLQEMIAQDYQN